MSYRTVVLVLLIGCRGPTGTHGDGTPPDTGTVDAAVDARIPDGGGDIDGAPMRRPCTGTFGSSLSMTFGRMDGYLVAIVPPGTGGGCHADTTHLHLQVQVNTAVYDVAVNVGTNDATNDVHSAAIEHALIGPAWSEGWHTDAAVDVDYPTLGVHASAIPLHTQTENVSALMTDLATANHVSIYATGYDTNDGAHLVHRHTGTGSNFIGTDGLVVTHPLSPTAHVRLFSFSNQTF
jgi:hypothetical protein